MDNPTQTIDTTTQVTPGTTNVAATAVPGASPEIVAAAPATTKMVPEGDLLAVKKGLEKQLEDMRLSGAAQLSESKRQSDAHYQSMLREKASREELENTVLELRTKLDGLSDAEQKVKEATDSRDYLANQMVDLKKTSLISAYSGVTAESLEGKSLQELNTLAEALELVKSKTTSNYDLAGGGGGAPVTGSEGLRTAIEEAKSRK